MFFSCTPRFFRSASGCLAVVLFAVAIQAGWSSAGAQVTGGGGQNATSALSEPTGSHNGSGLGPAGSKRTTITDLASPEEITSGIVRQLQRGVANCGQLEEVYRIDCLRQIYARAAATAGSRPDFAAARFELQNLADKLNGIVRQSQDRNAEKAKRGNRSYKAVARTALRRANRQARQAIGETATKLLRSAGNSKKRKAHYTSIANAVNSTKVILRS